MHCFLINPYYPISETPSPPLGLGYLAGALESAGFDVRIEDYVVFPYKKELLASEIRQYAPRIIGSTSVTMTFPDAIRVIQDVKQIDPNIVTMMGGPHVSFRARETLEAYPELDMVIIGEGEETIVEIARAVESGRHDWSDISGIAYRRGGKIVQTAVRPFLDPDTLPLPSRHLIALGRYRTMGMPISMTTSRGCPFQCIFCVGRKMVGAKVRYRNPVRVVDELESICRHGFRQVNIADDLFTANKHHCMAVCDEILRRNLTVRWTSFARVDTVSVALLKKMREAGCTAVSFGVESANAGILKTIKKGITTDLVVKAVDMCAEAGVMAHASFILGLPGETHETIKETMDFGEQLKPRGLSYGFHLLAPFPGTEVREKADEYGIKILTDDWSQYHANRAIVETETVDRKTLDDIVIGWEDEFNSLLDNIKQRMIRGEAEPEEAFQVINLDRIVLVYDLMMALSVENKGAWKTGEGEISWEKAISGLADRVLEDVSCERDRVIDTLTYFFKNGGLRLRQENGTLRWSWVNYL